MFVIASFSFFRSFCHWINRAPEIWMWRIGPEVGREQCWFHCNY